jgi:hypothetical protein
MTAEQTAINDMFAAYQKLRALGWNDAVYCPKDGTVFETIEAGSTGIHRTHYSGQWPDGSWWVHDAGDLWPSRPTLFRLIKNAAPCDGSPEGGETHSGSTEGDSAVTEGQAPQPDPVGEAKALLEGLDPSRSPSDLVAELRRIGSRANPALSEVLLEHAAAIEAALVTLHASQDQAGEVRS